MSLTVFCGLAGSIESLNCWCPGSPSWEGWGIAGENLVPGKGRKSGSWTFCTFVCLILTAEIWEVGGFDSDLRMDPKSKQHLRGSSWGYPYLRSALSPGTCRVLVRVRPGSQCSLRAYAPIADSWQLRRGVGIGVLSGMAAHPFQFPNR